MADPPRGGSGPSPANAGKAGSTPAQAPAASRARRAGSGFERMLSLSRIVVVVPVIVLLLSAVVSFA
jgi:hypothetical protein